MNENATIIKNFIREFSYSKIVNRNIDKITKILKNIILNKNKSQSLFKYNFMKYRRITKGIILNENATIIKNFIREFSYNKNKKKQIIVRKVFIIYKLKQKNLFKKMKYLISKYRRIVKSMIMNEKALKIQQFFMNFYKKFNSKKTEKKISSILINRLLINDNKFFKRKYYLFKYYRIIKLISLKKKADIIKSFIKKCNVRKIKNKRNIRIKHILFNRIFENQLKILKFNLYKYRRAVKNLFFQEQADIIKKFVRNFFKKVEIKIVEEEEEQKQIKVGKTHTSFRRSRREASSENAKILISSSTTFEVHTTKSDFIKKDDSISRRRKK